MAVKIRKLQARQRQQQFSRLRQRQQKARLSLGLRRQLLKDRWLRIRQRSDRWLQSENFVLDENLNREIYVVKDRILRERETRISER
jgi:hypothetical protein